MEFKYKQFMRLEHRYLKSFMAAAETENFTTAAEKVSMTQSGMSQHIAKLEQQLGVPLFKRLGKNVLLTPAGHKLVTYVNHYLASVESLFFDIQDKQSALEGLVSYAMPPSCLFTPHFEQLLEHRAAHPDLDLKVTLVANNIIYRIILSGEADFGFVTEKIANPMLKYLSFCQEEYIMVSNDPHLDQSTIKETLLAHKWVSYPGFDVYFDFWINHFFPELEHVSARSINKTSEINAIDGAIKMVQYALGLSVFPRHCVQNQLDAAQLFECVMPDKAPLLNDIYILQLAQYDPPYRVKQVIQWFMDMN